MTRVARPVFRKFKGEGADKYEPIARTILGQLEKRLKNTGQRYGVWRRTLLDGTKIFVAYVQRPGNIPPLRTIRILAPEGGVLEITEWYLESGLLSLEAWHKANCLTYRPAQRYYPKPLSTLADLWVRTGQTEPEAPLGKAYLAGTFLYGEHQEEGQSYAVGCPDPQDTLIEAIAEAPLFVSEFDELLISGDEELDVAGCGEGQYCAGDIQLKKFAQAKVPPSLWSGKLRLLVQALYGAKERKYEALQDTPLSIPPLTIYSDAGDAGQLLDWESGAPGLFTTSKGYYLVTLAFDGTFTYRKLELGPEAQPLWDAMDSRFGNTVWSPAASPLSDSEKRELAAFEAYIFAYATGFGEVQSGSFEWPDGVEGDPLQYGWKFNWRGNEATVVVMDRPLGGDDYNMTFNKVTVALEFNGTQDTVLAAVSTVDGPHLTRSRNYHKVWTPENYLNMYSHLAIYSCSGLHDSAALEWTDVPIYGWYDREDNWIEVVWSYEYVSSGVTLGTTVITIGCTGPVGSDTANSFTTTSAVKLDSFAVKNTADDQELGRITALRGNGSFFANAASWGSGSSWQTIRLRGWAPGDPSTPSGMGSAVLGAGQCGVGPATSDPAIWLAAMGYPYPAEWDLIGSDSSVPCTIAGITIWYDPPFSVNAHAYNAFRGPGRGEYFAGSAASFSGDLDVLIPWYDSSAAFLCKESRAFVSTLSYGWDNGTGNTAWKYYPTGEVFSCDITFWLYETGDGDEYPWRGSYETNFGPGAAWGNDTSADNVAFNANIEDRAVMFVGVDGIGRTIVDTTVGNSAYQTATESFVQLSPSITAITAAVLSNIGEDALPADVTWQDNSLWQTYSQYIGAYAPCLGVGFLLGEGPKVWQSANFGVIAVSEGAEMVAHDGSAAPIWPTLDDDLPYITSLVGWV